MGVNGHDLFRCKCLLVTQGGHLASPMAWPLVDALSGWIVNREDNHVVLAKIAQRVLLAGAYWQTVPVATGCVSPSIVTSPVPLRK
jgi:hypothetical protein